MTVKLDSEQRRRVIAGLVCARDENLRAANDINIPDQHRETARLLAREYDRLIDLFKMCKSVTLEERGRPAHDRRWRGQLHPVKG